MTVTVKVRSLLWLVTAFLLGVLVTVVVTDAWRVGAAPGDVDSTFVPTPGCRLVDTRQGPDNVGERTAPLGAGDVFEVTVRGANGRCTGALSIPGDAVGVSLNVTAVNATTSSNVRLYPANLTEVPLLSNLNVTAGGPPTPNKVDVQLSPDGKIKVYNFRGSVDVVLDVVGYYTKASLQELAQRVATLEANSAANASTRLAALEAGQPFAVSDFEPNSIGLEFAQPLPVIQVDVTAPVAGHVTVAYSMRIEGPASGTTQHACAPFRVDAIPPQVLLTMEGVSTWGTRNGSPTSGSLAGTRRFAIDAGETVTYAIACQEAPSGAAVWARTITAVFTPSP